MLNGKKVLFVLLLFFLWLIFRNFFSCNSFSVTFFLHSIAQPLWEISSHKQLELICADLYSDYIFHYNDPRVIPRAMHSITTRSLGCLLYASIFMELLNLTINNIIPLTKFPFTWGFIFFASTHFADLIFD